MFGAMIAGLSYLLIYGTMAALFVWFCWSLGGIGNPPDRSYGYDKPSDVSTGNLIGGIIGLIIVIVFLIDYF